MQPSRREGTIDCERRRHKYATTPKEGRCGGKPRGRAALFFRCLASETQYVYWVTDECPQCGPPQILFLIGQQRKMRAAGRRRAGGAAAQNESNNTYIVGGSVASLSFETSPVYLPDSIRIGKCSANASQLRRASVRTFSLNLISQHACDGAQPPFASPFPHRVARRAPQWRKRGANGGHAHATRVGRACGRRKQLRRPRCRRRLRRP
jgi:hypothetical protein